MGTKGPLSRDKGTMSRDYFADNLHNPADDLQEVVSSNVTCINRIIGAFRMSHMITEHGIIYSFFPSPE